MTEKQASSEIAQSRERFLEIKQRALVAIGNFLEAKGSRNVDVFTALPCIVAFTQREIEDAERDTRERVANLVKLVLIQVTGPDGFLVNPEELEELLAERIRGKE